jgi:hypothetical protein
MTLRKAEYTGIWKRKHQVALFGKLAVEEAMDPLQFRLLTNEVIGRCFLQGVECEYCCPFGCDVV